MPLSTRVATGGLAAFLALMFCRCSMLFDVQGLDDGTDAAPGPGQDTGRAPGDGAAGSRDAAAGDAATRAASPDGGFDGQEGSGQALSDTDSSAPDGAIDARLEAAGDAASGAVTDASRDGAVDGAPPDGGARCNPSRPFGTPVLLASLQSPAKEGGLQLLPDERTGFFWSTRSGGPGTANLYVTTRPDATADFGNVALLNNLNAAATFQLDPCVTADGLTLAFRSIRNGGAGGDDLYWASRANAGIDFSRPRLFANLNSSSNEVQPFLMSGGSEIYFSSDRTGDYDLYRATGSVGAYGAPAPVSELNQGGASDQDPTLSPDGLTIFYASTRGGGLGMFDVWMATRASTSSGFAPPVNVAAVNSPSNDHPSWVSADGCRLYLSSDATGATHIYLATRPP